MQQSTSRAEAERLLGIAEKLLQSRDLNGCRDFSVLAQETEPLLDGSDQILAVVDVLIASEKRINAQLDWYAVLQFDSRQDDIDLIKRQYRRLALLLHPDKNKYPFSDTAFKLVADAWNVLSDSSRKSQYDNDFFVFSRVDLVSNKKQQQQQQKQQQKQDKMPVRRGGGQTAPSASIWTACPYCYNLYEYPRAYEGCCLRCQNCERAFQAVVIQTLPPTVPGKDAYYCCWGFFPMGFSTEGGKKNGGVSLPMPPMFPTMGTTWPTPDSIPNGAPPATGGGEGFVGNSTTPCSAARSNVNPTRTPTPVTAGSSMPKKRGRPRKNPL